MLQPGAPSAHRLAKSGATLGFQDGPPFVGQQILGKNHDQQISTLTGINREKLRAIRASLS